VTDRPTRLGTEPVTTVSILLASNFPINIIWGPGRVQIYNDGYWPVCGAKHPGSLGQDFKECWASAWDAVGPPFANASRGPLLPAPVHRATPGDAVSGPATSAG
jgi:hypothetical protein